MAKTMTPKLEHGHYCYHIPEQDPEHGGYVPSIVVEHDKSGHYPMLGNGPCAAPWIWGDTRQKAQLVADAQNTRMGLSPERVTEIIASSMGRSSPKQQQA